MISVKTIQWVRFSSAAFTEYEQSLESKYGFVSSEFGGGDARHWDIPKPNSTESQALISRVMNDAQKNGWVITREMGVDGDYLSIRKASNPVSAIDDVLGVGLDLGRRRGPVWRRKTH